jgi:hypothetical protein
MSRQRFPIFLENPYDVQAVLEGLKIAKEKNKELIYMDRLLATLRLDPEGDIVNINYRILLDLELINLNVPIKNK